jgi:PAS domain S-box-containing protein
VSNVIPVGGTNAAYQSGSEIYQLCERLRDGFSKADMTGRIVECNAAFLAMLGYQRDEICELRYEDITPERWHAIEARVIEEQVLRRGYSDFFEKEYIRKDGSVFPVELRLYLLTGDHDEPTGMWAVARDVTERKKTEIEIQRVNSDLRQIFNASVPSCVIGVDHKLLRVNDTFCARFGETRENLVGKICHEIWHTPFCDGDGCPLKRIVIGETRYDYEWDDVLQDGKRGCFAVSAFPYRNPEGKLLGIIENYTDITERRIAEAKLRKKTQMLRLIMDHIPQSIFWKDRNSIYLGCNPEFLSGTDLKSASDIVGKTDYDMHWSASADDYRRDDREVMETGIPKLNYEEFQKIATGEKLWLRTSKVPLRDASGAVVGVLGMSENITERKSLEGRLRQAQKMEAIGQLAGGIAHDFNNLLGGIMGYAELLLDSVRHDESLSVDVQEIIDTSQRAADLVAQLLAFSRRGKIQSVTVDIHEVIDKAVRLLEHTIDRKIVIERDFKAAARLIAGDPTQLQNAILNLAVNARDAMPDGGTLTFATDLVTLSDEFCRQHGLSAGGRAYIEVSVTDTGIGMEKEILSQIFEPFFTTKVVGKGTGLGLAAVYGIVREHSGAISVVSEPGQGSIFQVYLPVAENESKTGSDGEGEQLTPCRATILIVDDEDSIRKTAARMLADLGYEVVTARNGREALQLYNACCDEIDLIILDMVMPIMNGRETLEELRKINSEARVLMSSGFNPGAQHDGVQNISSGNLVQKPYRKQDLARKVAAALSRL